MGFNPLECLSFVKFKLSALWPSGSLLSYFYMTLAFFDGSLLFGITRHFRLIYIFLALKDLKPAISSRSPGVLVENCISRFSMLLG